MTHPTPDTPQSLITPPVDRTGWSAGPWDNEGDLYTWKYQNFPCAALRYAHGGLIGYVGLHMGHQLYGKRPWDKDMAGITVHQYGIDYAGLCPQGIRTDVDTNPDWWFGFVCALEGDILPNESLRPEILKPPHNSSITWSYKTIDYVRQELHKLIEQIRNMASPSL